MGTCGCLTNSDCPSGHCNTDTKQCTGLTPSAICDSCDVEANNCDNGATCVANSTGTYPKCIIANSLNYGESCCKTQQCKGSAKCVDHGQGKKCYQGYGQACSPTKQCFYGSSVPGIFGPPEGDVGSVCVPLLPFYNVCNPSPCIPGAGLCGIYSCNPTGTIEISYSDNEVSPPPVADATWNAVKNVLSSIWDEGETFDPSISVVLPPELALFQPFLVELAQAHACINPGSIPEGGACIGTNHCKEGLTCKGIPFWSICVP